MKLGFLDRGASEKKAARNYWFWSDIKANELIHMRRPAEAGRRHVIQSIHASYQIKDLTGFCTHQHDTEVVARFYVHGQRDIHGPFFAPPETDIRVELQLSYATVQCDVVPTLTVYGYTEDLP